MTIKLKDFILVVYFVFTLLNGIYDGHARTIDIISGDQENNIGQTTVPISSNPVIIKSSQQGQQGVYNLHLHRNKFTFSTVDQSITAVARTDVSAGSFGVVMPSIC